MNTSLNDEDASQFDPELWDYESDSLMTTPMLPNEGTVVEVEKDDDENL